MARAPSKKSAANPKPSKARPEAPPSAFDEIKPIKRLSILVIDDDPVDRMTLGRALRSSKLDPEIEEAVDMASGLAAVRKKAYDCVTLDHLLPDGKSMDFLVKLRSEGIRLPIVVITGFGDEMLVVDILKAGASDYLPKEKITADSIFRAVSHAIRVHRADEEIRRQDSLLQGAAQAAALLHTHADRATVINEVLAVLGSTTGVDRAVVYENTRDPQTREFGMSHRNEWVRGSDEYRINDPSFQKQSYTALGLERWHMVLSAGHPIGGPTSTFPSRERELLESRGVRSALLIPVSVDNRFWGFIEVDDCHSNRVWTESEKSILATMASAIGSALIHRRANEALRLSEERYRDIVEDQADLVCRHRADGMIVYVNEAFCRYVNRKRDEIVGRSCLSFLPERARQAMIEATARISPESPTVTVDLDLTPDGGPNRWVQWTNHALFDSHGSLSEVQATGRDITDLKAGQTLLSIQRDMAVGLASVSDLGRALEIVLAAASKIKGVDGCGVYLVDEARSDVHLAAHRGISDRFIQRVRHLGPAEYPPGLLVETGSTHRPAAGLPPNLREAVQEEGFLAVAIVPAVFEGRVQGLLNAASRTLAEFPRESRQALEAIAAQGAGALARLQAQARLETSRTEHRSLVDSLNLGIFRTTPEPGGQFLDANLAHAQLLGYASVEELLGVKVIDLYQDKDERHAFLGELEAKGSVRAREICLRRKDGTPVVAAITARVHRADNGKIDWIDGYIEDVTERKRTEQALRISQFALEQAADAVVWTNEEGAFIYANTAASRITGYSMAELQKLRLFDLDLNRTPADMRKVWQAMKQGGPVKEERMIRTRDGRDVPCEILANVIEYGGREYNCSIARDISDRKRAEQALRESEEKHRTLVNDLSVGIFRNDLSGRGFQQINPECARIFRYGSAEEMMSLDVADLYANPAERQQKLDRLLAEGALRNEEILLKRKDGSPFYGSISAVLHRDKDGTPRWIDGVIEDVTERHEAEEALRQSREYLDTIINAIADPIFVKDEAHRFVLVNNALCKIVGRSREDLLGQDDRAIFPPDEVAVFWQKDDEVLRTGEENLNEERLTASDGTTRTIVTKKTRHTDETGRRYIVGIIRDMTASRRAEIALRESEARFRKFAEMMPQTVFEMNMEGMLTFINQAAFESWRYTPEDAAGGIKMTQLIAPEDHERMTQNAERRFQGDRMGQSYTALRKDGTTFPVMIYATPILRDGKPAGLRGIAIDISDRQEAEKALRESENKYRHLADSSPDMVYLCGIDGRILYVNALGARQFNTKPEDLIGRSQTDLFSEEVARRHTDSIRQVMETGQPYATEVAELLRGTNTWIETRLVPVRDESGQVTAVLGLSRDVSDRKRIEEERRNFASRLIEVQEVERREISAMLHDHLGQLLTLSRLELGSVRTADDGSAQAVKNALNRIDDALRSVRDLASSLRPPILDDLGIQAALEALAEEFTESSGRTVKYEAQGSMPPISKDEQTCMYRVLQEALTNAVKHSGGTEVRVVLQSTADQVVLEVADNGAGIENGAAANHKGLGFMGMRERVARCGGTLDIASESGVGTVIRASFPVPPPQG